jgi:hypothetical protein
MKRLPDELIGYVRSVEVARVNVVHSCGDGFAQNGDSFGDVSLRRGGLIGAKEGICFSATL